MPAPVKVSIITACYNAADGIALTAASVRDQTYPHIEYLVIDGQSTDATLERLEEFRGIISRLVSEPDKGLYDAMNKGLAAATGDVVYFLNAGDAFRSPETVAHVMRRFRSDDGPDLVYGKVRFVHIPENRLYRDHTRVTYPFHSGRELVRLIIPNQCIFAKKALFDRIGGFNDRDFTVHADYDWFLRAVAHGGRTEFIDLELVDYDYQGLSYRTRNSTMLEKIKAVYRNVPAPLFLYYLCFASARKLGYLLIEEVLFPLKKILGRGRRRS